MACHVAVKTDSPHIQQLAQFSAAGKPIPWNRIYRVPDFVWFSHASHVDDAAVACETCHGPVAEREGSCIRRSRRRWQLAWTAMLATGPRTTATCAMIPARVGGLGPRCSGLSWRRTG